MQQKQSPSMVHAQAKSESPASWLYAWLLFSAFITVPWMYLSMPRQQPARIFHNDEPTWSPDARFIAFASTRTGKQDIYVMNADGTNVRNLSQNSATDYDPAWSPDGEWIAFSSDRNGNYEIYMMRPDGTDVRRLTDHPAHDENPAWSPDSRSVAFWSDRDGNREIYVMNADGTNQRNLTNSPHDDRWPSWSPDSRSIVFDSSREGYAQIYATSADGTGLRNLTNSRFGDHSAAWSPGGGQITFVSNRDPGTNIYVMNIDGSGVRKITESVLTPPAIPTWDYVLAVLQPSFVQAVLLLGLLSSSLYVRRHTHQALLLAGLRVVSAVAIMGLSRGEGWTAWLVANGSLWFFGSMWGIRQINRGDCWLMRFRGEGSELPRPWAAKSGIAQARTAAETAAMPSETLSAPAPAAVAFSVPADPQVAFDQAAVLLRQDRKEDAIACYMSAFRDGSPELRARAVEELDKPGQVETS